jgi:hypothetical protein
MGMFAPLLLRGFYGISTKRVSPVQLRHTLTINKIPSKQIVEIPLAKFFLSKFRFTITRSSLKILKEMENIRKEELTSNWIELFASVVVVYC